MDIIGPGFRDYGMAGDFLSFLGICRQMVLHVLLSSSVVAVVVIMNVAVFAVAVLLPPVVSLFVSLGRLFVDMTLSRYSGMYQFNGDRL